MAGVLFSQETLALYCWLTAELVAKNALAPQPPSGADRDRDHRGNHLDCREFGSTAARSPAPVTAGRRARRIAIASTPSSAQSRASVIPMHTHRRRGFAASPRA